MSNVTEAFGNIRRIQRERVLKSFGVSSTTPSENISKSISEDVSEIEEVEKSDVLRAISDCSNPVKLKKSGKDIKEQISNVILPEKRAELTTAKTEAENLLQDCGTAPSCDIPEWWTGDIKVNDIPFKYYNWDETYLPQNNNSIVSTLSVYDDGEKVRVKANVPATQEQAAIRCKYNEKVRAYCEIITDITACEILVKNLKDNETIELNVRQIMAFQFDK